MIKVIPIKKCKKVLEKKGNKYTEKQVVAIRYFVYQLIEIYRNNEKLAQYEKRHNLHESFDRRTSE